MGMSAWLSTRSRKDPDRGYSFHTSFHVNEIQVNVIILETSSVVQHCFVTKDDRNWLCERHSMRHHGPHMPSY